MTSEPSQNPQAREPEKPAPNDPGSEKRGRVGAAFAYLPTVLAFAAIGGIAYWGHQSGWRAPKFSGVTNNTDGQEKQDWCGEHGVPESRCIKCHPELVGANLKDWCPEHGLPESKCTLCHPEILKTGVAGDWCPEHGLPESSCTLCHPEIAVKAQAPASETGAIVVLDPAAATQPATSPTRRLEGDHGHDEHAHKDEKHADKAEEDVHDHKGEERADKPEADVHDHEGEKRADGTDEHAHDHGDAAAHAHQRDPKTCQTHNFRVQFASADSVRKAGIRLAPVVERPMSTGISANAEVDYDRSRYAQLSSPVPARVWRVEKQVGERVRKDEVLALLDAGEVGKAKAELLAATAETDLKSKTVQRLRTSAESGFRTGGELQEAESALRAANIRVFNAQQALINLGLSNRIEDMPKAPDRRNMQFLGLPKATADSLDPKTTTANLLPVIAPFDGVVIEQHAVVGEVVETSKPLFAVADTTRMWINADLPHADARRMKIGQAVTFRPDGALDEAATGTVSWISTAVDDRTRTLKARAVVDNSEGQLLAHTFGKAQVTIREKPSVVAVPDDAIQWEGCCNIVFVRLTDDIFQTRKVKLGTRTNGFTEVTNGVLPGEVIASAGSHVLKSEILKSALGAGCAHGH